MSERKGPIYVDERGRHVYVTARTFKGSRSGRFKIMVADPGTRRRSLALETTFVFRGYRLWKTAQTALDTYARIKGWERAQACVRCGCTELVPCSEFGTDDHPLVDELCQTCRVELWATHCLMPVVAGESIRLEQREGIS